MKKVRKILAIAMVGVLSMTLVACSETQMTIGGKGLSPKMMTLNSTLLSEREALVNMNAECPCRNIWYYNVDDSISKMTIYAYALEGNKWEKKEIVSCDEAVGFLKKSSFSIGFSDDYSKMSFAIEDDGGAGGNIYKTGTVIDGEVVGSRSTMKDNANTIEKGKVIPMYFEYGTNQKRLKEHEKFMKENSTEQLMEKLDEISKFYDSALIVAAVFE